MDLTDLRDDGDTVMLDDGRVLRLRIGVVLELCEGEDHCGAPIVRDSASLWGIDSLEDGYLLTVVGELWGELNT